MVIADAVRTPIGHGHLEKDYYKNVRVVTMPLGLFDTAPLAMLDDDISAACAAGVPHPRRLGTPGRFAAVIVHILENRMINGQSIRLDAAQRIAPA